MVGDRALVEMESCGGSAELISSMGGWCVTCVEYAMEFRWDRQM